LLLFLSCGLFVRSQVTPYILITDADDNTPLPLAFIVLKSLGNGLSQKSVSNQSGMIEVPVSFSLPIEIKVNYLGYIYFIDTIRGMETFVVKLQKDARYLKEAIITDPLSIRQNSQSVQKFQVLDAKIIEQMAAINLKDVLTNQLNFRISQDNATGSSNLSLQGIGGQNVKILIDGVPIIGRVFDQVDLAQLNLNNIERIEIVEGPLSVSYGTNALAGVINIVTKKQTGKKLEVGITSYNESNRTHNNFAFVNISGPKLSGQLNVGRNFFGGWSLKETDRTWDWNLKEQYYTRAQFFYNIKAWELNYRLEGMHEKLKDRGTPNIYGEKAIDEYFFTNRLDNILQINGKIKGRLPLQTIVVYNIYNRLREKRIKDLISLTETKTDNPQDLDTTSFKAATIRSVFQGKKSKLSWLAGLDLTYEWGSGGRIKEGGAAVGDFAAFTSSELAVNKKFQIRGGIRAAYHTLYNAPLIPSLQMVYSTKLKWLYRASWAKGFRAPTLKELYLNFVDANHQVYGSANLEPEKSDNFQAGVEHKWNRTGSLLKVELNLFYNDIRNKIDLLIISPTEGSYTNFGSFNSMGGNWRLTYNCKNFGNQLGLSYTGIKNSGFQSSSKNFNWTPEIQFNTNYKFEKRRWVLSLFVKYNGAVKQVNSNLETNEQSTFKTNPYTWMDFNVIRQFKNGLTLGFGVKNLLNITNVSSTLVSGVHSQSGSGISIGTGRTYYLKMDYKWNKK
jgi:outer membrane receptor for ferrienterochelin and colicins